MSKQLEAAQQSFREWLVRETDSSKAPKIEPAGEFTHNDQKYYLFKYKRGLLGKWLLGVCGGFESPDALEHSGHIYSDHNAYDPATAEEQAIALIDGSHTPNFISFVLLSTPTWDEKALIADMIAQGFTHSPYEPDDRDGDTATAESDTEVLFFEKDSLTTVLSLMPAPVPGGEAEKNAATNYFWPEAVEVTKSHTAHIIAAVLPQDNSVVDAATAVVQATSACAKLENALGIYTAGTVFEPKFYLSCASSIADGQFPLLNLVYLGFYGEPGHMSAYTFGLNALGKDELEVLDSAATAEELHSFLCSIADYVITSDVTLRHGETIGFSAEEKLPITRSKAVAIAGMTIKIGYRPA